MEKITVVTLIDITETKQHRKEPGKELEIKQQQNFSTLLQTIGMRVNPVYDRSPRSEFSDGTVYKFGHSIIPDQKIWIFEFYFDYEGGFTDSRGSKIGLLLEDLHLIPIIDDLTESATLEIPVFDTKTDQYRNTIIFIESDK
jgi:hypothetical protein